MFWDRLELKPYVLYSAAAHAAALLLLIILPGRNRPIPSEVYRIDFIGPSAEILNRAIESEAPPPGAGKAAPPAGKVAPETRPEEFAPARKHHVPLPRPSVLAGEAREPARTQTEAGTAPEAKPAPAKQAAAGEGAGSEEAGGASVSPDLPNFPYPWYITQVRGSLWAQWSSRMPGGGGEAVIMFEILRNGQITDVRVESSSGDRAFDYVALGAAQDAAPFPPLPNGFPDAFLKIHVRFKSQ